jgi:hypothetical protein
LVNFIKKFDVEQIEILFEYISSILYNVDELLTLYSEDTIHIPVATIKELSNMNEEAVSKIAHESPLICSNCSSIILIQLFGSDLLGIWTNYET